MVAATVPAAAIRSRYHASEDGSTQLRRGYGRQRTVPHLGLAVQAVVDEEAVHVGAQQGGAHQVPERQLFELLPRHKPGMHGTKFRFESYRVCAAGGCPPGAPAPAFSAPASSQIWSTGGKTFNTSPGLLTKTECPSASRSSSPRVTIMFAQETGVCGLQALYCR